MSVITTVVVDCPVCERDTDARLMDCDACYERWVALGAQPFPYDGEVMCEHVQCLQCQTVLP